MRPAGERIYIEKDGEIMALTGYLKDGINWIQLRELDEPLGYASVTWDAARKLPIIKTKGVSK